MNIHPIEKIGSYLHVDEQGFIVNPTSMDTIQTEWLPVVEDVKEAYLQHFGDNLHSVYVRGSVAKGQAIKIFPTLIRLQLLCCHIKK